MAITDPIGDLLARIRNGQLRGMATIKSPNSRLRTRVLDVLKEEGFIRGYSETEFEKTGRRDFQPARATFSRFSCTLDTAGEFVPSAWSPGFPLPRGC